jgi:hypothetical protein
VRSSEVLATFKAWADDNFGGIRSAFAVFDGGPFRGFSHGKTWWTHRDFISNNGDILIYWGHEWI